MGYKFRNKNDIIVRGTFTNECTEVPTVMYYREKGIDMINYGEFKEVSFKYDTIGEFIEKACFRCATGDRTISFNSDMDNFFIKLGDTGIDMTLQEFYYIMQLGAKDVLRG